MDVGRFQVRSPSCQKVAMPSKLVPNMKDDLVFHKQGRIAKTDTFNKSTGVNMKTLFEQYREQFADILYCCYCLEPKGESYSCCDENHFIEFQELDIEEQKEIINAELDENQRS